MMITQEQNIKITAVAGLVLLTEHVLQFLAIPDITD
jgi:hypothetical protein